MNPGADPTATSDDETTRGRHRRRGPTVTAAAAAAVLTVGLVTVPAAADPLDQPGAVERYDGFDTALSDLWAAPDGSVLVVGGDTVHEARRGAISEVLTVPTPDGEAINGIDGISRGSYFLTTGGPDEGRGTALLKANRARVVSSASIEDFEVAADPDANAGPAWKDPRCEGPAGFTPGPQSNPYHVTATSPTTALVADAAGNTLLSASTDGSVELVAVFTPPTDDDGDYLVLFALADGTDCYVQPVPTTVAIGPDGATYVGELTGVVGAGQDPTGHSRIWRIEPGATGVTCPSAECEVVVDGLTAVTDMAFAPDGTLLVVEFDEAGFLTAVLGAPIGGAVDACDVDTGTCTTVEDEILFATALDVDIHGNVWLLEQSVSAPVVRVLELD